MCARAFPVLCGLRVLKFSAGILLLLACVCSSIFRLVCAENAQIFSQVFSANLPYNPTGESRRNGLKNEALGVFLDVLDNDSISHLDAVDDFSVLQMGNRTYPPTGSAIHVPMTIRQANDPKGEIEARKSLNKHGGTPVHLFMDNRCVICSTHAP